MTETVRWGILGASAFALKQMAPAIHMSGGGVLAAVATRTPEKAAPFAELAPGLRIHDSYDDLLADPGIDAVYVPLPNTLHVEWALKAMDAGKPVLVEKPIAMAAGEIDNLIAKRRSTGVPCAEAYMIVHHPQWHRAREMLRDGAIGELIHVDGVFTYDNRSAGGNIRNRPETGGGGIPDIGVYTYGATRWATGQEPLEITHADVDFENGVDVRARVSARFDGFTAHWVNSMRMFPRQEMVFHGDAGILRLTAPFNPITYGEAALHLEQPGAAHRVERFPTVNQYVLQVEAFGRTVKTGEPFAWSLEDARGTQTVIDWVFEKAGKP